ERAVVVKTGNSFQLELWHEQQEQTCGGGTVCDRAPFACDEPSEQPDGGRQEQERQRHDELERGVERDDARVMQERDEPVEERRVEIGEGHAAEVCVRPTEGVWEDRLVVELRDGVMA